MVQLLVWNQVETLNFSRCSADLVDACVFALNETGIASYVGPSQGIDAGGACCQLGVGTGIQK